MRRCIQPSGRSRQVIPTSRERSIDLIDLSPSYAEGSSSGLPWHCWLSGPRPPAATHPISSNRPGNTHCSRAPCSSIGCSSAHTQLRLAGCCHPPVRVVSFVFLFFFFFVFLSLLPMFYTHSWEKGEPVREKKLDPIPAQASSTGKPPSLCSALALTRKKVTFRHFIPQCHRENSQRWTQTG